MIISIVDSTETSKSLFSNRRFSVLPPQRRFKWQSQQITQFFTDITKAKETGQNMYFLGTLLLKPPKEGFMEIIDGQQRLTTMTMLLAVLRDKCLQLDIGGYPETLNELLSALDNARNPLGPRLQAQPFDDGVLQYVTQNDFSSNKPKPGFRRKSDRVFPGIQTLKDKLEKFLANKGDASKQLVEFTEYILGKTKFLPLEVESEELASVVFDTTNTRGLPLSPSEALRARLAVTVRDDPAQAKNLMDRWISVATDLETEQLSTDSMDDYILAIWTSGHGYATKRTLAGTVIEEINKKHITPDQFTSDLVKYVQDYLSVIKFKENNKKVRYDLEDLQMIGFSQSNGFLTMVHHHSPKRFGEAVKATLALQVRNIIVDKQKANIYQQLWPQWSMKVREGKLDEALQEINTRMIDDGIFQARFEELTLESAGPVHHILRRLELEKSSKSGVTPSDVHREHVMPQAVVHKLRNDKQLTPNVKKWISYLGYPEPNSSNEKRHLGDELAKQLDKLGNQALLDGGANSGLGDRSFDEKKDAYLKTKLELTKSITQVSHWDGEAIQSRQEELASLALKAWPRASG